jgi:two-component system response regulator HydG
VLLVDDGESSLSVLQSALESAGHIVAREDDVDQSARRIAAGEADVVVLSTAILATLGRLVETRCGAAPANFLVLADRPSSTLVRTAMSAGATHVIDRASDEDAVLVAVERCARDVQLERELAMLRARVGDAAQGSLIGRSSAMMHLRAQVGRAAGSRSPVLVLGEAGTGKDVVARLVHDLSDRAGRPMVTVRCAGVDAESLERDLFGCAARSGLRARAGLLEEARGGTLVLEDALTLPAGLRALLASAIVTQSAPTLGGREQRTVDVRLVLTARAAGGDAQSGPVNEMLARFNAMLIVVPPLRERRSDIPQLVQHFRQRLAAEQQLDVPPLAPGAMLPLLANEWPGNVRELEHWAERSIMTERVEQPRSDVAFDGVDIGTSELTLEQLERAYILHILALESGHQSRTAARLGIDRRTLYRKLKQYRGEDAATS